MARILFATTSACSLCNEHHWSALFFPADLLLCPDFALIIRIRNKFRDAVSTGKCDAVRSAPASRVLSAAGCVGRSGYTVTNTSNVEISVVTSALALSISDCSQFRTIEPCIFL